MKIYTRTGDSGATGLFGGERVAKTHPRVEAYGAVDELNACVGLAAAGCGDAALAARLTQVQARLFDVGADLATPPGAGASAWLTRVPDAWVADLESEIDAMEAELAPLTSFILPGGTPASAALHLARTVCRRAERRVVGARSAGEDVSDAVAVYLNRLSDWLFVAARLANARAGVPDVPWVAASAGEQPDGTSDSAPIS
jgi:cob(I)alamin adenosyltransferase